MLLQRKVAAVLARLLVAVYGTRNPTRNADIVASSDAERKR